MKKTLLTTAVSAMLAAGANAQDALPVVIDSDLTLAANSSHKLVGVHYVAPGATLTIEEGVTVYAELVDEAPALIVAAGATIDASGTADSPIVFTSLDALTEDLDHNDVGLWSGIILLGNAQINADATEIASGTTTLTNSIEGIDAIGRGGLDAAVEASYLIYGGSDDTDSSGTMEYVSIRHTGFSLTGEAGDEIQGLTLGGVGSGTTLENIEIFVSDDDGIEIFGGTANLKNIVIGYAEDDSLDFDQGYRGTIQNALVVQVAFTDVDGVERDGDHGGEWDGADTPETNDPASAFTVANATFIQTGVDGATNDDVIRIRNGGAGTIWNSVVVTNGDELVRLDNNTENNLVETSVTDGDIKIYGGIFYSSILPYITDDAFALNDFADAEAGLDALFDDATAFVDPSIDVSVDAAGKTDIEINLGELYDEDNITTIPDAVIPPLADLEYVGAFAPGSTWADWTFMATEGYFTVNATGSFSSSSLQALSGRFNVAGGEAETIVGLILEEDATIALTAKGASISTDILGDAGVANFLADPEITVLQLVGGEFVEVSDVTVDVTFPEDIAPDATATSDEAVVMELEAGVYGIRVTSGDGEEGIALVEAYDIKYFN